jgi:N-acetylmuramoyl-L-alanine amidase
MHDVTPPTRLAAAPSHRFLRGRLPDPWLGQTLGQTLGQALGQTLACARRFARLGVLGAVVAVVALAGCAINPHLTTTPGGVPIDVSKTARGQDSRVLFLILHYTVADFPISMKILTENDVSSHYLLSDESPPRIFRLVDENRRAWHSGVSGWKGHRLLNASSIGIEIVHPGVRKQRDGTEVFVPFPEEQIQALIPLVKDIVARHQIRPDRILGHGEVTPAYKQDPGPTFPWKLFAELGITPPWPDAGRVLDATIRHMSELPDIAWFQQKLFEHGYPIERTGVMDEQTQRVLMNFQMRYRPTLHDGQPDAESAGILEVLTTPAP